MDSRVVGALGAITSPILTNGGRFGSRAGASVVVAVSSAIGMPRVGERSSVVVSCGRRRRPTELLLCAGRVTSHGQLCEGGRARPSPYRTRRTERLLAQSLPTGRPPAQPKRCYACEPIPRPPCHLGAH